MTNPIEKKLQDLTEQRNKLHAEIAGLTELSARFPDLKVTYDRWDKYRYESAQAIPLCDDIEIGHNCGCCEDSPLELRPFANIQAEYGTIRLYAPGPYRIGEKNGWNGDFESPGWEDNLRACGFRECIIEKTRAYFEAHKPEPEVEEEEGA